ncbi:MAG: hypothetical protein HKN08_07745, partial [Gammaproteobacteria bacterium]|nr:hypothetical protein [Gammaproteobacteria bacterium]
MVDRKSLNYFRYFLCPVFYLLINSAIADELTDAAQSLIDNNRSSEAYQLLIPELDERAGTPDYDILLGIAALDVNRPTEAV